MQVRARIYKIILNDDKIWTRLLFEFTFVHDNQV